MLSVWLCVLGMAEEHFKQRQLDLEKMTGACGIRAPPPTATGSDEAEKCRTLQLIAENRKLAATLEDVQKDMEKRAIVNGELSHQIVQLKEEVEKLKSGNLCRQGQEAKFFEEMRIGEFRLRKAREEIVELKERVKELGLGNGAAGYEIRRENVRLKKLIGETIVPLLRQKDELISKYECLVRVKEGSEELLRETDKLTN